MKSAIVPYTSRNGIPIVAAKKSKYAKYTGSNKQYREIRDFVQRILNAGKETKYVGEALQGQVLGQSAATPAGFIRLIPNITQGVAENQRIGDRVQATSLRNVFTFNWSPGLMNNQDVVINLWIVTVKGASSAGTVNGILPGNFLKVGNGGNTDPADPSQPNMLQLINHYPLNTDQFTLKRHYRFRMRRGPGLAVNSNAGEVAPTGVRTNDHLKVITYSQKPPVLKYNTNGDQTPTNFYPVALMYCTNADGTAYGDTIQYSVRRELYYKDA